MASKTRAKSRPKLAKPEPTTPLERVIGEYLDEIRDDDDKATKTWRYYEGVLVRQLLPWCRKVGIADLDHLDDKAVKDFMAMLRKRKAEPSWNVDPQNVPDRPLAEATANSYGRAVNRLLSWAEQAKLVGHVRIKLRKPKKQTRPVLELADIQRLEDAATTERDKLLIRILADTGMRASELTSLEVDDVLPPEGPRGKRKHFLRIQGAKSGDQRKVGITAEVYERLVRYRDRTRPDKNRAELWLGMRRRPGRGYMQLSPSGLGQILASAAERAKLPDDKPTNPHNFRHSRITRLLRQKMDPGLVAKIVGHTSLAMIYEHYDQQTEENAADALIAALEAEEKEARR